MKIKAYRIIALAFALLVGIPPLWAADGYRPVVLVHWSSPEKPLSGYLIGAYKDGKWYEPTDLPIKEALQNPIL